MTEKVVERTQVGTWQNPPYRWQPQATLSCHRPEGRHWIERSDVRLIENGAKPFIESLAVPAEVLDGESSYSGAKVAEETFRKDHGL